ncbi:Glycos_transf_1 domain-containing protein [Vibrio chagasii]|nr:Glycos_transf_1 domain-containing protein [Vibrio chagasii]CAH6939382.1 Glycos_transf_1 domain-containing protein [Vibrio chagasii]CAH7083258.1 Glycos_transf_1 domain-containing protein [Vibrio chagasii]CAH7124307.1 Glycos_transf_1 domain-containing protein [Vibrio chagasii]
MQFITNVTLGYGNQNYISLSKILLENGVEKIEFIEPLDYERDYYDLNIEGFKRKLWFLKLGNLIRSNVDNVILKKVIIKILNILFFNFFVFSLMLRKPGVLITARYIPLLSFLPKKYKIIFYCTELFEVENRKGILFNCFVDNIDVIISAQRDRLEFLKRIFVKSRFYLVENCPFLSGEMDMEKKKDKSILYQGRVGKEANAELLLDLISESSDDYVFHIAGPIDKEYEDRFRQVIDNKKVKYYGYLRSKELRELRRKVSFGLITWKDTSINTKYCAPNKLYEYLQSGLVVVAYKNHSMINLNSEYKFGYVSVDESDNQNILDYINGISDDAFKNQSNYNYDLYSTALNYNAQIIPFINEEIL